MSRFRVRPVVVLVAIALIASACGDSSSAETEAAYMESVQAISSDSEAIITETFDSVFADAEGRSFEALLPDFSNALGTAISIEEDALARFEALDPPPAFQTDHELFIEASVDQLDALKRQRAAADAGDTELIAQIDLELQSLAREFLAGLSPEFAQSVVSEQAGSAAAALFGGLEADETEYLDAVATGWDEFQRRNRSFGAALERSYRSNDLLLLALLDAGAGEAFAAVREVIVELDPPQSYVDGHAQLLAHLDEAVALDTIIAQAAETGDVVGFEVANYRLALASARYALEAPESLVAVNADPVDLVPPSDLPEEAYGEALWRALQRFRILALQPPTGSGVFPIISDDKLAEALALTGPTAIQLTEDSIADLESLAPPAEFRAGHDRLLVYLRELVELRGLVVEAAEAGELETLRTYGALGSFAADRAETELWCAARSDLADDPIEPATATFFRPFDVATVAQLCPAA